MTTTAARETVAPAATGTATAARDAAVEHLLRRQHPEGWWKGELATNVTMDAEDLLLREILGVTDVGTRAATARWIRSQQRSDGTWATYEGGPGDLSTTVEAYLALRLAGDPVDAEHLRRAAGFVRDTGGIEATRVFTRIWLAMVGLWPWEQLPAMPPELVLLPAWGPVSIYDFGCWARQTVVPLTVVWAHRPVHPLPVTVPELHAGGSAPVVVTGWRARGLRAADSALQRYERHRLAPLRRWALRRAVTWILDRQELDGSWGGIQPPWVYSLLALRVCGYPLEDPAIQAGLAGLDRFTIIEEGPDGPRRRLEACQSPVWDTALALIALADAGVDPDHPQVTAGSGWLAAQEIRTSGDWSVRRPTLPPSGFAFEFDNDVYPDIDDTAEVVLALSRTRPGHSRPQRQRCVRWTLGMQSRDGGWGAFDADNTRRWPTRLPFCDFGEVIDPPSADVTAHLVEMLAAEGLAAHPATQAGVRWLLAAQEEDGSWFGRWGVNHIYGTGAVLPALVAAGVTPDHPALRRGAEWLAAHQQPSGGWGEDIRSYTDPSWRGRGEATPSQTGWALLGLLAVDQHPRAVQRGVDWLIATQRSDGGWDEPQYTGTGFPADFSINYHLYRVVFPLSALGRYCRRVSASPTAGSAQR